MLIMAATGGGKITKTLNIGDSKPITVLDNIVISGGDLKDNENKAVKLDKSGNIISSGYILGNACTKTIGTSSGRVPTVGTSGWTNDNADFPILIDGEGKLTKGTGVLSAAAYRDVNGDGDLVTVGSRPELYGLYLGDGKIQINSKDLFSYNNSSGILTINY